MAQQLEAEAPGAVAIVGVNESGLESSNDLMTAGRTLPWLQDRPEVDVWHTWPVAYRDVILLDGEGRQVDVYNLTLHDLSDAAFQAELAAKLRCAAGLATP